MEFNKKNTSRPWHPNFRDAAELPSVKMVRVDVLMKVFTPLAFIACCFLASMSYMSYQYLAKEVQSIETELDLKKDQNESFLKEHKLFVSKLNTLREFKSFYSGSVDTVDILLDVSQGIDKTMVLEQIELNKHVQNTSKKKEENKQTVSYLLKIQGMVEGSYEHAIESVNKYVQGLKDAKHLKDRLESVDIASLERNPELNLFTYEIELSFI